MNGTPQPIAISKPNFRKILNGPTIAGFDGDATFTSTQQANDFADGIHVILDITNNDNNTDTLQVVIEAYDPASNSYYALLTGTATKAVATAVYKVFPGSAVSSGVSANDFLTRHFRVRVVHSNPGGSDMVYTLGYNLKIA